MGKRPHLRRRCLRPGRRGFTLIEIMIVVVIIAALAAMVVPRLAGRSEQAREAIAKSEIYSEISTGLKLYELDNGNFPTTEQGLAALLAAPTSEPRARNWQGPYLEREPADPWNNAYRYRSPGTVNDKSYDLFSLGKDGIEGTSDDVTNWKK